MKNIKLLSMAGLAGVLLSGCASVDTDMVAGMQTTREAFSAALHKEYVMLAVDENKEGDGEDAQYFIDKAKNAGLGLEVMAQPLGERDLPAGSKKALASARNKLTNMLWKGAADETPEASARAQAMFDCWMQEQEENDQPDHIDRCKAGFAEAYSLMRATPVKKMMAEPKKPMVLPDLPPPYIVYFGFDSADLDSSAMTVIKSAYADFRLRKPNKILVQGHTDSRGDKKYNEGLSRHRAAVVGNTLMELGIPRKMFEKSWRGEALQRKKTPDDTKEGENRRAVIIFTR